MKVCNGFKFVHSDRTNLTCTASHKAAGEDFCLGLTRKRLFLLGFGRYSGKQQKMEAMKEETYLLSFKAETSSWGRSGVPNLYLISTGSLKIVSVPGPLLSRGSGHCRGLPSRLGYRYSGRVMNHCGLKQMWG